LHAQAPFQLGDQFAVRGADFLVNVNAFAVLGHAVRQLARAPVLGLLDLAAFSATVCSMTVRTFLISSSGVAGRTIKTKS